MVRKMLKAFITKIVDGSTSHTLLFDRKNNYLPACMQINS